MAWYRTSKLVSKLFHNLASPPKQLSKIPLQNPYSGQFSEVLDQFRTACSRFDKRFPLPPMNKDTKKRIKVGIYCGIAAAITTCCCNIEFTPYRERPHVVLVPKYVEKKIADHKIRKIKEEFKDYVLPPQHPLTVKVSSIMKHLADAPYYKPRRLWMDEAPSIAQEFPEYQNWEVIVIDRPIVKVCCYAAKIVIFTGLLDRLESDAEIATVICHEVGHDLARHGAEKITKHPWSAFRLHLMYEFYGWEIIPIFRKIEREADFIGLMIMASAGYDPRVAPTVYNRLTDQMMPSEYCSDQPSLIHRALLLSRPEVMQHPIAAFKRWKEGQIRDVQKDNVSVS